MLDVGLALAAAVAKPGTRAMYIDANNGCGGWATSLVAGTRSGRAFCVEVGDNILALDADHANLAAVVLQIGDDLRRRDYCPVIVRSGGEGRLHLFCLISDSQVRQQFEARAAVLSVDVRKGGKRIRPPLAPHRRGLRVELLTPVDPREALAALLPRVAVPKRDVSLEILFRLRDGGKDRSATIQSFAVAAARAGWNYVEFAEEVVKPLHRAGSKFRDRRDCQIELIRSWRKAHEFVAAHPFEVKDQNVEQRVAEILKAIREAHWTSRKERTARRVLRVHLEVASRLGRLTYSLDVRTIAEHAGHGGATVSEAHELLRHLGWITRHPRQKPTPGTETWPGTDADTWTIQVAARDLRGPATGCTALNTPTDSRVPPLGVCRECSAEYTRAEDVDAGHDLWRERGGLGKAKFEVYRLLDTAHARHAQCIAIMLTVGKRIMQRHLAVLRKHDLALAHDGRWVRGSADPNDVAKKLGIAGERERQQARHKDERDDFKAYLRRKKDEEEWLARLQRDHVESDGGFLVPPISDAVVDGWARENAVRADEPPSAG